MSAKMWKMPHSFHVKKKTNKKKTKNKRFASASNEQQFVRQQCSFPNKPGPNVFMAV